MKYPSVIAIIAVIIAIGAGVIAYKNYAENIALKGQLATQSSPMGDQSSTPKAPVESTVVEKKIAIAGSNLSIQYRCSGEIKKGVERIGEPAEEVSFCVGDYELVAANGSQSTVIASGHATDAHDAPVLLSVQPITGSTNILIAFKSSCASTGDCGVGMPTNEFTHVLHTKDSTVQSISHFPPNGTPVWNALATKALFIPRTCGGAGCDMAPILGYDVTTDQAKDLTNEKGVGLDADGKASDATDPAGNRLPIWQSVTWNVGDSYTAKLINSDGSVKSVNGTF